VAGRIRAQGSLGGGLSPMSRCDRAAYAADVASWVSVSLHDGQKKVRSSKSTPSSLLNAPRQPPTSIEEPPRFEREWLGSVAA
jgi:hypothetical protein